jgi:hypothetical protein
MPHFDPPLPLATREARKVSVASIDEIGIRITKLIDATTAFANYTRCM